MRKSWLWSLALLAVLAAASYGAYLYLQPEKLPDSLLYGNGRIEAVEVAVASEVAGRILESRLVEGERVRRGDLLVRVDDKDLRISLAQSQAEMSALVREKARLQEELRVAAHHAETMTADARRYRELEARGTVGAQRREQADNAFREARGRADVLQARLGEVDARIEAAWQRTRLIESQVEKAEILSPIDGTILVKAAEAGELAQPGRTVAVLADLSRLELRVFVPESDIGKVKLGDPARVRVDAFGDRTAEASVLRVDQRAQFTPRDIHTPEERVRLVFGVTLSVANLTGELKPGMPADAWILWRAGASWPERLVAAR
mgnify:FL=1